MTIKQLAYRGLPQIAVAVGATTPNPGSLGVQVWSTSTSSVLVWNGTSWQVSPFTSQTANTILAAPNGASGIPSFRSLVVSDIPTLNQNTTGNAATASAVAWSGISGKPTTLGGYGITDAISTAGGNIGGVLRVSHTGSTTSYVDAGFEVITTDNTPPGISFHRAGYSATLLYESNGELYANAWVARSQSGKLISSGNYNEYSPTLTGTGASGTWGINISGNAATVTNGVTTSNISSYAQAPLVSGTNIKTVNGTSLLGSGDIVVSAAASSGTTLDELEALIYSGL